MTYTASQVQSRKEARKHGWSKCTSCGGRGGWYQRGIFAQTIGCEHCGGLGYIQPIALSAAPQSTVVDMPPTPSVASDLSKGSRQAPSTKPSVYIAPDPIAVLEEEFRADVDDYIDQRQEAAMDRGFALQTPNLIERWQDAVKRARAAQSPIERREWLTEAQNLCERLSDPSTICACGVALNLTSGRCEACDERERAIEDRRAHIGETGRQRDAGVPF